MAGRRSVTCPPPRWHVVAGRRTPGGARLRRRQDSRTPRQSTVKHDQADANPSPWPRGALFDGPPAYKRTVLPGTPVGRHLGVLPDRTPAARRRDRRRSTSRGASARPMVSGASATRRAWPVPRAVVRVSPASGRWRRHGVRAVRPQKTLAGSTASTQPPRGHPQAERVDLPSAAKPHGIPVPLPQPSANDTQPAK